MTDIINLNDNNLLRQKSASEVSTLTATLVQDEQRVGFWPQHFGNIPQWIILEPTVFAWMDRFCADYSGGIWNFYTL
ncbi:antirestriction protein, partial [Enterobacter kobei]